MNYSWQIVKLETRNQTNADGVSLADAVVRIKWRRSGIDADGNTATIVGYTILDATEVQADSFINFNDLTEEVVLGWLETSLSKKLEEYNNKIQQKINRKFSVTRAVPWS